MLDAKGVEDQLATMPGKNELRATLLATLQAPLQSFVALLAAPAQNFVYLLSAKERAGGEPSNPPRRDRRRANPTKQEFIYPIFDTENSHGRHHA